MKYWVFFLALAANSFQAVQACGSNGSTEKGALEDLYDCPNPDDLCVPEDNCDVDCEEHPDANCDVDCDSGAECDGEESNLEAETDAEDDEYCDTNGKSGAHYEDNLHGKSNAHYEDNLHGKSGAHYDAKGDSHGKSNVHCDYDSHGKSNAHHDYDSHGKSDSHYDSHKKSHTTGHAYDCYGGKTETHGKSGSHYDSHTHGKSNAHYPETHGKSYAHHETHGKSDRHHDSHTHGKSCAHHDSHSHQGHHDSHSHYGQHTHDNYDSHSHAHHNHQDSHSHAHGKSCHYVRPEAESDSYDLSYDQPISYAHEHSISYAHDHENGHSQRKRTPYHQDTKYDSVCKKVERIMSAKEWKPLKTKSDILEAGELIEKARKEITQYSSQMNEYSGERSKKSNINHHLNAPKSGNNRLVEQAYQFEEMKYPITHCLNIIYDRRSPIHFDSCREIPARVVAQMFEAARWAPSWENAQPWKFSYVSKFTNHCLWEKVACNIQKPDQDWARSAPAFIVAITRKDLNGKPNPFAKSDLGQAIANMTYQALYQNVYTHQIARINADAIAVEFCVPCEFEVVMAIAVGYIGYEPTKPIRIRKPLCEVFTVGKFDE